MRCRACNGETRSLERRRVNRTPVYRRLRECVACGERAPSFESWEMPRSARRSKKRSATMSPAKRQAETLNRYASAQAAETGEDRRDLRQNWNVA